MPGQDGDASVNPAITVEIPAGTDAPGETDEFDEFSDLCDFGFVLSRAPEGNSDKQPEGTG